MCPKKFYIGQAYDDIRINEIHYNPQDEFINGQIIRGRDFEFIELKNRGTTPVNLSDVIFERGVTIFFPDDFIIPPGGFAVLAEDAANFELKYGFPPDLVWEGRLDNGGETLRFIGPDKETIDRVNYDDVFPWNPIPDQGQYSLALIDCSVSNNSPANWTIQSVFQTPGAPNVFGPNAQPNYNGLVINEIHYHPRDSFHIGPDTLIPSKEFEFVELRNIGSQIINLTDVEFIEGINYKFDDGVIIPPGQFNTLAEDSMWFHERYGFAAFDKYDGSIMAKL